MNQHYIHIERRDCFSGLDIETGMCQFKLNTIGWRPSADHRRIVGEFRLVSCTPGLPGKLTRTLGALWILEGPLIDSVLCGYQQLSSSLLMNIY